MKPMDFLHENAIYAPELNDPAMDAVLELEAAARVLDLEDWIIERLRHTESEAVFNLPLMRDSGEPMTTPVLHVVHSTVRGDACGVLTLAADEFWETLRRRAMSMTWRNAIFGLPFGGAATAIVCDPRSFSERELHRLATEFGEVEFAKHHVLMPAAEVNECIAGWVHAHVRAPSKLVMTGKPGSLGGVAQDSVAAEGICELVMEELRRRGTTIEKKRVAIQGFTGLGMQLAFMLHGLGAEIAAVADVSGGVVDARGLEPRSLSEHVKREGVLLGYLNAEQVQNADVLESECDLLVLSDGVAQITEENCERVKATVIVEAVPNAVVREAEGKLAIRSCDVIPDVMADAAVLAAFVENAQRGTMAWTERRRKAFVRRAMREACTAVREAMDKWELPLRQAAVAVGVERVAAAVRSGQ